MASGTISGGNYNSIYSYYMTWSSVSNGSVENTSNVTLNWVFKKNASDPYGSYNKSGSSKVTLVINGSSSGAMRADFDLRSASTGTTKNIATYTLNNIPHNSDGTCKINVSGSHATGLSGSNWGTKSIGSTEITLDTIPRYATCSQSLNSTTETSIKVNWTSDSTIDYVWYSKDNGSNWTAVGSVNATSGNYTISGLSAGTSYNIKTRVRRKDSQLTTDSSKNSWSTNSYPYISAVGTTALTIGNSQTLTLYNPLKRTVTIYMKTGSSGTSGTQLYTGTTSSTSKQFTPTASTLYNQIPNAKSGNCVYYVTYTDSSDVTHTSATTSGTTYVVNESANKPTVTSYTPYDKNSTTYELTNDRAKIVLNASNMQLTIVATAKNSATFNNNGYIKVNGTSLTLTKSGSNATGVYTLNKPSSATYTITLKDSRGIQSGDISYTLPSYVNYFVPTMVGVAKRNQPTDGIINLSGSGKFFSGSFGNSSNTLAVTYKVVKYGTSTQLESGSMTVSKSGNNHSESQKQVSNATYTDAWTVTFTVTDALNTITSIVQVTKGVPIFNWDNDEFDVNVATNLKGNTTIGGILDVQKYATDLKVESIESKNLYNKENYSQTGYLNNDGSRSANSSWIITDYISVTPGEKITISGLSYPGQNPSICYYDTNRTFLSGAKHNTLETRTVTIPSNCYYIRESISATYDLDTAQIERGESATTYSNYQGIGYTSGKNENGNYMKFDDGTMIEWNTFDDNTFVIGSAYGSLYQGVKTYTFPVAFIEAPTCVQCGRARWGSGASWGSVDGFTKTTITVRAIDILSRASGTKTHISWLAIGRWK